MAFCSNCGKELAVGDKFCSECGTRVQGWDNTERKTVYDGELHKCPNCGEVLESFEANCPVCGYELRGAKASSAVREFALKLEAIESKREYEKPRGLFSSAASSQRISKTDEQKISLIRSFSIPNTKEDISEFIILAASNINLNAYGLNDQGVITASQKAESDAWLAKFEQAYQKAQVTFGTSPEFLGIEKIYEDKMKALKRKRLQLPIIFVGSMVAVMVMLLFLALMVHLAK